MSIPKSQFYFTSDTHYNHANICMSTSKWEDTSKCRYFHSLEYMNTTLVNNINSIVGKDDILFHLGDWSFGGFDKIEEFRNRITCKNIHIITGNHDHHIEKNTDGIRSIFSSVNKYLELTLDGIDYVLMHFPISSWNKLSRGSIHLHGHVHFNSINKIGRGRCMDVGVEGNAYLPYSINEIRSLLLNKNISSSLSNDHHNKLETHI